jgi:hypothetical protein
MAWMFIARLVLGLMVSALSDAMSPRPRAEVPRAAGLDGCS